MLWLEGHGVRIEPIGACLAEHVGGAAHALHVHALDVGSAHVTFASATQLMVQPIRAEIGRVLRHGTSDARGPWRVCTPALSCELPQGMAVLATKAEQVPFELRFSERTLPAPRLFTFAAAAAPRAFALADGSRFIVGPDFLGYLEPMPGKEPTQVDGFAAGLTAQGKTLMRKDRLPGAAGDIGTVELAGRDPSGKPVRERWYLIPLDAEHIVPLVLMAEPMKFDVAAQLADCIAASTKRAAAASR